MNQDTTFEKACQHARQTALLQSTLALLEWDQHTKMPPQAAAYRADQITALATQVHARRTDAEFGGWIEELATATKADDACLLYTSPSPRDQRGSRMPSSA